MPLYQQISDELLTQINTARLRPGDRLPSERKLMRQYQASDTSVRRALAILRDRGYIEKKHGSGNYVLDKVCVGGDIGKAKVLVVGHGQFGRHVGMGALLESLSDRFDGVRTLAIDTPVIEAEQLRQLLRDYDCPIIMINSRNQTASMAAAGMLANLEKVPGMNDILDRVPDNLKWRFAGLDGRKSYYGCPYLYVPCGLAVNLDLAKRAGLADEPLPRTWSELLEWCRRFTAWKNLIGERNIYAAYFGGGSNRTYFFMAANGKPYSLSEAALRPMLQEYFSLFEQIIAMDAMEPVGIQAPDPFVSGRYLFCLQGYSWLPRDVSRFRPELHYRMLPPPVPASGRPRFTGIGTSLLSVAIPPGRENGMKAVLPVLNALFEPEWYINLSYNLGCVPADLAVFRKMVRSKPEFEEFYDAIFTSLEPHCAVDEVLEHCLDEIMRRRFADPSFPLIEMIDEYVEFYLRTINQDHDK